MSAISLKSITGITSITTPAGVDNQLTLHNNNTTEAVKLDTAGNLHFHNHLNITGVSTASNFKTGTSNLHNTGLNVFDLDVDGHTNLDNVSVAGVTTMSGNLTISNTDPRIIFVDTNNNPDFTLHANGGEMQVENSGSGTQVKLESSGSTRLFGNVIANKDLDVDGHTNLDNVSVAGVSTYSGAATFTEPLTLSKDANVVMDFSANSTSDARGIYFNSRAALTADYNDGFLRLNNQSQFSNGVYTPGLMRADGGFKTDGNVVVNSSGFIVASRIAGALPAIDGSNLTGNTIRPNLTFTGQTLTAHMSTADPAVFVGDSNRTGAGQHLAEFRGYWDGNHVARIVFRAGDDTTNKDDGVITMHTTPSGGGITERFRIDSNGMIGFGGVTPKTQNTFDAIEFGRTGFLGSQTGARTVEMVSNAYYNSGWKYKENDVATQYYQYQGGHFFGSAASGNADAAVSFSERLRITTHGGSVVNKGGSPNAASGWAGLEVKAGSSEHQLVLSSTATASNSNQVRLGFKLHPSNDNERVKAAIICQGSGGGYGEPSRMMFCLDSVADNGSASPNSIDEKLRIMSTGELIIYPTTGNNQNTSIHFNNSASTPYITFKSNNVSEAAHISAGENNGGCDLTFKTKNQSGTSLDRLTVKNNGGLYTHQLAGNEKGYPIIMATDTVANNTQMSGSFNYHDFMCASTGGGNNYQIGGWVFLGNDYGPNPYPARRFQIAKPGGFTNGTLVYQVWHNGDSNYHYGGLWEIRINCWTGSSRFESVSIRCVNGSRDDMRVVAYNDSKGIMIQPNTIWGQVFIRKAGWDDGGRNPGSSYCAVANNGALAIYNGYGTDDGHLPSGGVDLYPFDGTSGSAGATHTGGYYIENGSYFDG